MYAYYATLTIMYCYIKLHYKKHIWSSALYFDSRKNDSTILIIVNNMNKYLYAIEVVVFEIDKIIVVAIYFFIRN